jgi:hypothetical protein
LGCGQLSVLRKLQTVMRECDELSWTQITQGDLFQQTHCMRWAGIWHAVRGHLVGQRGGGRGDGGAVELLGGGLLGLEHAHLLDVVAQRDGGLGGRQAAAQLQHLPGPPLDRALPRPLGVVAATHQERRDAAPVRLAGGWA